MDLISLLVGCIITNIVWQVTVYNRSARGDMDVEWDDEKQVWKATMHIPSTINYSKKKKLIININEKK